MQRLNKLFHHFSGLLFPKHTSGNEPLEQLHSCGSKNGRWALLPNQSSSSTGESKFKCSHCGVEEFRGGWGSSIWLEKPASPSRFKTFLTKYL